MKNIGRQILRRFGLTHTRVERVPSAPPMWTRIVGGPLAGREMMLDVSNPEGWQRQMRDGQFETFIAETLNANGALAGQTVWDIGGHIGFFSMTFAALAGEKGRVIAFEPNPANSERMKLNFSRNPELQARITIKDFALSDTDGQAPFLFNTDVDFGYSSEGRLAAISAEEQSDTITWRSGEVITRRIDTVLEQDPSIAPDVIKMDVEGGEALVLAGAGNTMRKYRPRWLIEIHNVLALFRCQQLLSECGYNLSIVNEKGSSASRCHLLAE